MYHGYGVNVINTPMEEPRGAGSCTGFVSHGFRREEQGRDGVNSLSVL